jgi:hypothetical protein
LYRYVEARAGSSLLGNQGLPRAGMMHTLAAFDEGDEDAYYDSSSDDDY